MSARKKPWRLPAHVPEQAPTELAHLQLAAVLQRLTKREMEQLLASSGETFREVLPVLAGLRNELRGQADHLNAAVAKLSAGMERVEPGVPSHSGKIS